MPSYNSLTVLHVVALHFSILNHDDADKEANDKNATRDAVVQHVLRLSIRLNADQEDQESEYFTHHKAKLLERLRPAVIALLDVVAEQRVLHDRLNQHT